MRTGVCVITRRSILRIDFDTILAKKKKEGRRRRLFEEMESGPSFRTLFSIGGRGVQVSSWAACS